MNTLTEEEKKGFQVAIRLVEDVFSERAPEPGEYDDGYWRYIEPVLDDIHERIKLKGLL